MYVCIRKIAECLFADDGALLGLTRSGAERAALVYQQTSSDFGLTVSIPKTKHMVSGRSVEESDREPIAIEGGMIDAVDEFISHIQLRENGRGCGQANSAGFQGFWWIEEGCVFG